MSLPPTEGAARVMLLLIASAGQACKELSDCRSLNAPTLSEVSGVSYSELKCEKRCLVITSQQVSVYKISWKENGKG